MKKEKKELYQLIEINILLLQKKKIFQILIFLQI